MKNVATGDREASGALGSKEAEAAEKSDSPGCSPGKRLLDTMCWLCWRNTAPIQHRQDARAEMGTSRLCALIFSPPFPALAKPNVSAQAVVTKFHGLNGLKTRILSSYAERPAMFLGLETGHLRSRCHLGHLVLRTLSWGCRQPPSRWWQRRPARFLRFLIRALILP